ncbi:MAG: hypothetical protein M1840_002570 [Geoglossum simile]|nr:MAG: hypothetical protein M1840_002570 [Geoglossum simile]
MATFDPIPYTYVPTAPRFKSTKAPYNRTLKQVSILDKIQRIKVSGATLSMPRLPATVAAANDSRNDEPGIRKTSTIYSGNDKEKKDENDDNDNDLPTIEDLLSALGEDSGSSPDDPTVLLEDDDLSASEAEVDHGSLRAKNAKPDAGHFDSPETTTVQPLRLNEGTLTLNSMCPYSPSLRLSSKLLHDCIDKDGLDMHRARSEAATSHSACPQSLPQCRSRASTENRLGQEDRLYAGRSTADEREYEDELVRPALNTDAFDKGERQQQEAEAERKVDKDDDEDDGQVQQAANGVVLRPTNISSMI